MDVWRIEHPDHGQGPYTCPLSICSDLRYAHGGQDHPSPSEDFGFRLFENPGYVCGFTNFMELAIWFDGWTEELTAAGFKLYRYEVPPASVIGGTTRTKQCCFLLEAGEVKEVLEI